jgi:hypothetical protein
MRKNSDSESLKQKALLPVDDKLRAFIRVWDNRIKDQLNDLLFQMVSWLKTLQDSKPKRY